VSSLSSSPDLPLSSEALVRQRRFQAFGFLAAAIPLGLSWRLAPLHLPPFAFKYGGSALWAIAVYWLVAWIKPRWRVTRLALTAAAVSLGVELLKKVYWPPLDHFRESLAGKLLLGRYFSFGAIVAYWLAIAAVATLDRSLDGAQPASKRASTHFGSVS
jgi:hypothetical protein